jgi:hypothetical protein
MNPIEESLDDNETAWNTEMTVRDTEKTARDTEMNAKQPEMSKKHFISRMKEDIVRTLAK